MKKIYLSLLLSFIMIGAFSQKIVINEGTTVINKKATNAWVSSINEDIDLMRKSFTRFAKDKYDVKTKKKSKQSLVIEKAKLPTISNKQGDLWVSFYPEGDNIKMSMAYLLGYDIAITSHEYPEEMKNLNLFYREFILYYKTEYFNSLVAEDTKRIKELSMELKKNQRELKSLSRTISRVEKSISKENDEVVKFDLNNKNIESKAKIQAKHEIVLNLKNEISKMTFSLDKIRHSFEKLESESFE